MSCQNCFSLEVAIRSHPQCILHFLNSKEWTQQKIPKGEFDLTPLEFACLDGPLDSVELILRQDGVDINCNSGMNSALGSACARPSAQIVELLLSNGAQPLPRDFRRACANSEIAERLLCLQLMLDHKQSSDLTDEDKAAILSHAASRDCVEIVRFFLDRRFPIDGYGEYVPLVSAAQSDAFECVTLLCERGADVNRRESSNAMTPLLHCQSVDVARVLLQSPSIIVNAIDSQGKTALHHASSLVNADLELCRLLLDRNIDINARDQIGRSALHYAEQNNHVEIVALLKTRGATESIASCCSIM